MLPEQVFQLRLHNVDLHLGPSAATSWIILLKSRNIVSSVFSVKGIGLKEENKCYDCKEIKLSLQPPSGRPDQPHVQMNSSRCEIKQ